MAELTFSFIELSQVQIHIFMLETWNIEQELLTLQQRMKTCAVDSLVWRLSIMMAHALHMLGGAKAAAHLWHEFCQELQFRWMTSTIIPG